MVFKKQIEFAVWFLLWSTHIAVDVLNMKHLQN